MHSAYISVGSNIGNRLDNCQQGIDAIAGSDKCSLIKQTPFYITEPVDYQDQDWFINTVIKIKTILDPFQLLDELKTIEHRMGRIRHAVRFGPRILDLDIILYDDAVIHSTKLIVPHPRMHKRCFVLKPLCDIDPNVVHPVFKKDMQYLLDNLNDKRQKVLLYE